tara:strand:+ start:2414 stop:2725 length:312 start_codon:yes stop_codon:yes gene_type:complete
MMYNKKSNQGLEITPIFIIIKGTKNTVSIKRVLPIILLFAFLLVDLFLKWDFTLFLSTFENSAPVSLENFGCIIFINLYFIGTKLKLGCLLFLSINGVMHYCY